MKRNESNQTRGGLNKKQKRGVTLKRKDVVTKVQKSVGKGKHKSAGKGKQKVSGGEAELGKRNKAIKREKGTMVDDDVDFNKKKHVLPSPTGIVIQEDGSVNVIEHQDLGETNEAIFISHVVFL
ncbi:hypothetical protein Tco_0524791 [Tanacetum coccineum]